ncbi:MAG: hypothetical protein WEC80_00145, partial [Patescibacteria group bacterium]
NYSPEIYHIAGSTNLSPYEAVKTIASVFDLDKDLIRPNSFSSYYKELASIRPQFSSLKSVKNDFYKMSSFEDSLHEIKKQLH